MSNEQTVGESQGPGTIPGWGSLEFSRRMGLKALGVAAAAGGVSALTDAAASYGATKSTVIKIGFVTPSTGALASFAGPDNYVLKLVRASQYFAKGIKLGGTTYKIQIITADSQSSPSVAAQVTTQLIQAKGVDIVVTSSAPETAVPVSTVCEQAGIPCVSTVVPWEAWYVGLGGTLSAQGQAQSGGFKYCTTFFFGVPEFVECFLPMWNR
ncbi:MAG TPA: ABC transporter substrate-binding protein, partial [Acidimicrobiales bacterium]|nr:ABC transporter substrate-binding protein [Acidimicrobiales bacterium]